MSLDSITLMCRLIERHIISQYIYIFLINVKVIFYYSVSKQHLDKVLGGKTTV